MQSTSPHGLAPLYRALMAAVGLLPTAAATAKGGRGAVQLKVVLVVVGLLIVLASDRHVALVLLGFGLMASAMVLPLAGPTKRRWLASLERRCHKIHTTRHEVELVHDGGRLELWRDGAMVRRVLTHRAFGLDVFDAPGGHLDVRLRPDKSRKKKDAIWLRVPRAHTTLHHTPSDPKEAVAAPFEPVELDDARELLRRIEILHERPQDLKKQAQ